LLIVDAENRNLEMPVRLPMDPAIDDRIIAPKIKRGGPGATPLRLTLLFSFDLQRVN
jgi:hypothetical protein